MTQFSLIKDFSFGLESSVAIYFTKNSEDTIKEGSNYKLAAIDGLITIFRCIDFSNQLFAKERQFSILLPSTLCLSVYMVGIYAKEMDFSTFKTYMRLPVSEKNLKSIYVLGHYIAEYMTDVLLTALTVVSISRLFFGKFTGQDIGFIAGLGLSIARHKGIFSQQWAVSYDKYFKLGMAIIALIIGSPLQRFFSIFTVVDRLNPSYFNPFIDFLDAKVKKMMGLTYPLLKDFRHVEEDRNTYYLTSEQVKDIFNRKSIYFSINYGGLEASVREIQCFKHLPNSLEIQNKPFSTLKNLFESIDWEEHVAIIWPKVKIQKQWIQNNNKMQMEDLNSLQLEGLNTEQKKLALEWFRTQFNNFYQKLTYERTSSGSVENFSKTQKLAKQIIGHLEKLKSSPNKGDLIDLIDSFAILAIEGGNQCITAIETAISEVYKRLTHQKDKSIKDRVSEALLQEREREFQTIYKVMYKQWSKLDCDEQDLHNINLYKRLFGRGLILDNKIGLNDSTVVSGYLFESLCAVFFPSFRINFWGSYKKILGKCKDSKFINSKNIILRSFLEINLHSVFLDGNGLNRSEEYDGPLDRMISVFKEVMQNRVITSTEYISWWNEYRKSLELNDIELIDEDGKLIQESFIVMLIEMGFLKLIHESDPTRI